MATSSLCLRSLMVATAMAPAILFAQGDAKTLEKLKSPTPASSETKTKEQAATYTGIATDKLQRQSEKLSDKRDSLQEEIDRFKEFGLRLKAAQEALQTASPPNVDTDVQKVVDAVNTLAALSPNTSVFGQMNSPGGVLVNALIVLHNDVSAPILEILRPVLPSVRPPMVGQSRTLAPPEAAVEEATVSFPDPRQEVFLSTFTPALLNLSNRIAFQQGMTSSTIGVKRADLEKEIVAAQEEDKDLVAKARAFFDELRKRYFPILTAAASAIQRETQARNSALTSINQQLPEIEKELKTRAESVSKRQGTLTDKLIWTELLMIVAILLSILFLRLYSEQLALTMVQERTLGDLLGTGLLLITIIFLAVGDFVDKSALVTLLGTIAGYIFARRSTPAAAGTAVRSSTPAAPKNLQQMLPVVTGEVSVKCDPVEGAESYRWYTKSRNARSFVFRQQTAEPQVTFKGPDAAKILEVAVSAGNGREGKRSAPIQVTAAS